MLESLKLRAKISQENLNWVLNSSKPTVKVEFAFRPTERKTHGAKALKGDNKLIQAKATLAPPITRNRQLSVEELKSLNLPLIFQGDTVTIERSLNGWKLKNPVTIKLNKILEAQEKGLVDYIIASA